MNKKMSNKSTRGITLVALVVTIVVLLILAGITITYVMGDNSVFKQVQNAKLQTEIAKAREQLEVTLGHAQLLKHTDKKYNQEDYLDDLIEKEIQGVKIEGNTAIVNGYAFEMDRSVPKIGEYVGKEKDLVFPEVKLVVTVADDKKKATITITAKEEESGIHKIEVLQEGYVIKKYDYENIKTEIIEDVQVKQNGKYVIKVYGNLTSTEKTEVTGLIASVKFSPNGNENFKKEHTVTIKVEEAEDKVKNIKYQWLETTTEPAESTFSEAVRDGAIIKKNGITGRWFLWILVETESGKTNVIRSEGFNFDNEEPTATLTGNPLTQTSFKLKATGEDTKSNIAKYEIYVGDKKKAEIKTDEKEKDFTINVSEMGKYDTYVLVTDEAGNVGRKDFEARTLMHTWEQWNIARDVTYEEDIGEPVETLISRQPTGGGYCYGAFSSYSLDKKTGKYTLSGGGSGTTTPWVGKYNYTVSTNSGSSVSNVYSFFYCHGAVSGRENYYRVTYYRSKAVYGDPKQGTKKEGYVYDKTQEGYPETEGEYNNKWLIYLGIQ